jgi:hypothetical protein
MTTAAIPSLAEALARGRALTPAAIRVLRFLETIADEGGIVRGISQERIAFGVGCSSVTAINSLDDLERAGYVAITRTRGHGPHKNAYALLAQPTA